MNSREFAKKWLEKEGLFDEDSDYDGMLGNCAMALVYVIATQGHSGGSAYRLIAILDQLYKDYDDGNSIIWKEYWESDEGKKLIASIPKI